MASDQQVQQAQAIQHNVPVQAQPQAPAQKPTVPMIDRIIKFVDVLEPILKIAHVVLKGIKEALHEYKQGTNVTPAEPPGTEQIVNQLGPQQ